MGNTLPNSGSGTDITPDISLSLPVSSVQGVSIDTCNDARSNNTSPQIVQNEVDEVPVAQNEVKLLVNLAASGTPENSVQVPASQLSSSESQDVELLANLSSTPEHCATGHAVQPSGSVSTNADSPNLPDIKPARSHFCLCAHSSADTHQIISAAYEDTTKFRPNIFSPPLGSSGHSFVKQLGSYFMSFGLASAGEGLILKVAYVLQQLILQKPFGSLRDGEQADIVKRRMKLWEEGQVDKLIDEAKTIQGQICKVHSAPSTADHSDVAKKCAAKVTEGKIGAAACMLEEHASGGPLKTSDKVGNQTVLEILKSKHPEAQPFNQDAAIPGEAHARPNPILLHSINRDLIRKCTLRTQRAAGPSGVDATGWHKMCTSFRDASDQLCDALACRARRIATIFIDPVTLEAYTACRLIPLDKRPGVRAIGIGEVVRRIIGKAILAVAAEDIQQVTGSLQLCGGQESGLEATIHATKKKNI